MLSRLANHFRSRALGKSTRSGFTLVELLAVLFILGILIAILLPAVQQVREAARRTQCRSNLHQLGLAMHSYHETFSMFPPGNMQGLSLHVTLLPFIDQRPLHDQFSSEPDRRQWIPLLAQHSIALYQCPSDPAAAMPHGEPIASYAISYLGNFGTGVQTYGYNGMFHSIYDPGPVRTRDVTDGLSHTAAISESLVDDGSESFLRVVWVTPYPLTAPDQLEQFAHFCRQSALAPGTMTTHRKGYPWPKGQPSQGLYNHVLFPNDASCLNRTKVQEGAYSASSLHQGIVHVLCGDGHVNSESGSIDFSVWRALGSRNGGS